MQKRRPHSGKWFRLSISLGIVTILFVSFQNFSIVPLKNLRPNFARAYAEAKVRAERNGDIRHLAPEKPAETESMSDYLATPQSGTDLNSVSSDWMRRQTQLITGGAEKRLLSKLNRKVTEKVLSSDKPQNQAQNHRGPASIEEPRKEEVEEESALKLTALNRVQLDLGAATNLSCSVWTNRLEFLYSKPINENMGINLKHVPQGDVSSLSFNYKW